SNRVAAGRHDDRNRAGRFFGGAGRLLALRHDDVDLELDEFGGEAREPRHSALRPSVLERDGLPLHIAEILKPSPEGVDVDIWRGTGPQEAHMRNLAALLGTSGERREEQREDEARRHRLAYGSDACERDHSTWNRPQTPIRRRPTSGPNAWRASIQLTIRPSGRHLAGPLSPAARASIRSGDPQVAPRAHSGDPRALLRRARETADGVKSGTVLSQGLAAVHMKVQMLGILISTQVGENPACSILARNLLCDL